ncbi:hypothetical protein LPY66_18365 [Dehalobacter sp. DCM]|uniref:hypothetical protein n=1 Tax=Dehalobacter sp. DCM TaxID=2907827 RepID=UPI00308204F6|nr:hypothetical protein LPY66_18365 [Dehalobacter sp. DCM]
MNLKANNIRSQYTESGQQEIVLSTEKCDISELKQIIAKGKILAVEIKQYRHKRSLDANACLWSILQQIAEVIHSTKDEVYLQMLELYGVFTHIIVKPHVVEKVKQEWRTVRELGEVTVNGQTGIQLMCFFGSSTYDSKEFSVLLDGVISEAKSLGIDVMTEEEKNLLLQEWGK